VDLENFDKIYCMDLDVYEDVISKAKNEEQRQKISLFLQVLGDHENAEVPDPYWGDMDDFEKVFQLLDKGCNMIAKQLTTVSNS
jgi:protein-tyrosine phosphatase